MMPLLRFLVLAGLLPFLAAWPAQAQSGSAPPDSAQPAAVIFFIRPASDEAPPFLVTLLGQPPVPVSPGTAVKYIVHTVGEVKLKTETQLPATDDQPARTDTREQLVRADRGQVLYLQYGGVKTVFTEISRSAAAALLGKIKSQSQTQYEEGFDRPAPAALVPPVPVPPKPAVPKPSAKPTFSTIHFVRSDNAIGATCQTELTLAKQPPFLLDLNSVVHYTVYSQGELTVTLALTCPGAGAQPPTARAMQLLVKTRHGDDHYVLYSGGIFKEVPASVGQKLAALCPDIAEQSESVAPPANRSAAAPGRRAGKGQGTCFLISPAGYLITNYHCIENSQSVKIKGIKGDFSVAHAATVVASDPSNDLALLKLTDPALTFPPLPYLLRTTGILQAERIYALGFPVAEALGTEIKITEGIISARSGLHGDVSKFQISAAVNPGNSGGPLIDENGNLIGVVYAKISGPLDATGYAVKSVYLDTFLKTIETFPYPTFTSKIATLPLPQKVAELEKCIFLLETN